MPFLLLAILGFVALAVILVWSLIWGALLGLLLPLTLFEGALLVMLASLAVLYAFGRMVLSQTPGELSLAEGLQEMLADELPPKRFFTGPEGKTWENGFRYQSANVLLTRLEDDPGLSGLKVRQAREALAIRLADLGTALVKDKGQRGVSTQTRLSDWKHQMRKEGLKPYDDDLLRIAAEVVNGVVAFKAAQKIIRDNLWDELTDSL